MSSNGEDAIRCPFCSAPYKKLVPQDVLQLNCDYCGATFRPPPKIGLEIPRCGNHPERYAVGKCNDCGGEFCSECLQTSRRQLARSGQKDLHPSRKESLTAVF